MPETPASDAGSARCSSRSRDDSLNLTNRSRSPVKGTIKYARKSTGGWRRGKLVSYSTKSTRGGSPGRYPRGGARGGARSRARGGRGIPVSQSYIEISDEDDDSARDNEHKEDDGERGEELPRLSRYSDLADSESVRV